MDSYFSWPIGLALATLALVYWKLAENYDFFKKRGIPFVKPIWLLGSNVRGALQLESTNLSWDRMYHELKGHKIGGFFQFTKPMYVLREPEYISKVFINDFSHFYDRGIKIDEKTNPLEGNLFLLPGQKWRYLRNKLSPIFTLGKLKWMYAEMHKCGDAFMDLFKTLADGEPRDFKDPLARLTTDVIGSCAFGFEPEALNNADSKFRIMGKKLFQPRLIEGIKLVCRMSFPELFDWLKIRTTPADITEFFCDVIKQAFEFRKSTGSQRNDIVQLLLQLREKGSVEIDADDKDDEIHRGNSSLEKNGIGETATLELTDELLTAQSFVFFNAGFETTSSTLQFTLYELAKHPEVQEKCREEVKAVIKKHGAVNYDALKDMEYLEKCINETLRLFPPLPTLFRECTKSYVFPDGTKIDKGQMVILPMFSIQRDADYFPDPDEYKPERFDSPPKPGTYAPFGDGPRICIGKRFALLEMKMALARILDGYKVEKSTKTKEPIEFASGSFVLVSKHGVYIKVVKLE